MLRLVAECVELQAFVGPLVGPCIKQDMCPLGAGEDRTGCHSTTVQVGKCGRLDWVKWSRLRDMEGLGSGLWRLGEDRCQRGRRFAAQSALDLRDTAGAVSRVGGGGVTRGGGVARAQFTRGVLGRPSSRQYLADLSHFQWVAVLHRRARHADHHCIAEGTPSEPVFPAQQPQL
jgi:hypothetical protein